MLTVDADRHSTDALAAVREFLPPAELEGWVEKAYKASEVLLVFLDQATPQSVVCTRSLDEMAAFPDATIRRDVMEAAGPGAVVVVVVNHDANDASNNRAWVLRFDADAVAADEQCNARGGAA